MNREMLWRLLWIGLYVIAGFALTAGLLAIVLPESIATSYLPFWGVIVLRLVGIWLSIVSVTLFWERIRIYVTGRIVFPEQPEDNGDRRELVKDRQVLNNARQLLGAKDRNGVIPAIRSLKSERDSAIATASKAEANMAAKIAAAVSESAATADRRGQRLEQTEVKLQSVQAELSKANNDLAEANRALDARASQIATLEVSLSELQNACRRSDGELANANSELEETKQALDRKAAELAKAEEQSAGLRKQLDRAVGEAARVNREIIEPLKLKLSACEADATSAKSARAEAESRLLVLQREHGRVVRELGTANAEVERIRPLLVRCQEERTKAVTSAAPLKESMAALRQELATLQSEREGWQARVTQANLEVENLRSEQEVTWRVIDILTHLHPDSVAAAVQQAEVQIEGSDERTDHAHE